MGAGAQRKEDRKIGYRNTSLEREKAKVVGPRNRSLDRALMPIPLGAVEVLALVDGPELEEALFGAALGAVAAQAGCPPLCCCGGRLGGDLGEGRGGEREGGGSRL